MLIGRKERENNEKKLLAPYAAFSADGERKNKEKQDLTRTSFQRDCHRIYHSKAFRRMQGKRQVLSIQTNDHIRTRLTHTLEVTQIARSIARTHALNEDLTEAIALGHDLGHTPFGHPGEDALNYVLEKYGSEFEHNKHSLRIVTELETRSQDYAGLNLTYQALDGLNKHRENLNVRQKKQTHLEGQIVNLADEIAYNSHDLEDAVTNEIVSIGEIINLKIWQYLKLDLPKDFLKKPLTRDLARALISLCVKDLSFELSKNLKALDPVSSISIQNYTEPIATFSLQVRNALHELKNFLWDRYYQSEKALEETKEAKKIIIALAEAYLKKPEKLPNDEKEKLKSHELVEVVKDYIAGMTDVFAENEYCKINN